MRYRASQLKPYLGVVQYTLAGLLVGYLVYLVGTHGNRLSAVCVGAVVGAAIGLWRLRASESMQLSEMTLSVPNLSEIKFVVNATHRTTAWELFVDTSTRIATQPLPDGEGDIRVALDSLHSLFVDTRERLKAMGPSPTSDGATVELLAFSMLNSHLRPFLSKWHPRFAAFEAVHATNSSASWSDEHQMRKELETLRGAMLEYARGFGLLSGVSKLEEFFPLHHESSPSDLLS
jgi:hypothetical protein